MEDIDSSIRVCHTAGYVFRNSRCIYCGDIYHAGTHVVASVLSHGSYHCLDHHDSHSARELQQTTQMKMTDRHGPVDDHAGPFDQCILF